MLNIAGHLHKMQGRVDYKGCVIRYNYGKATLKKNVVTATIIVTCQQM